MAIAAGRSCSLLCRRGSPTLSPTLSTARSFARSVAALSSARPDDEKLVSFGKHMGLSYADIALKQPDYGAWVLKAATKKNAQQQMSPALLDLASYLGGPAVTQKPHMKASVAAPIEAAQLTREQHEAAQRILSGENAFITGAAGVGKSFLLRYIIQELKLRHPEQVAITASTGIASANIGGQTLHSWAAIGLGWGGLRSLTNKINKNQVAQRRWTEAKVLLVDEVSMIDGALFTKLEEVARRIRGNSAPFGGLQLVLCGDFLQLPPVQDSEFPELRSFCFQTEAWQRCGLDQGVVLLQEQVRQAGDSVFANILNEVRLGKVSSQTQELFKSCSKKVKPPPPDDGIVPTKLYCTNKEVDRENTAELDKLEGEELIFKAEDVWTTPDDKDASKSARTSFVDTMNKRIPKKLSLKVGAQVILIKNKPKQGLVNGSRGIVEGFRGGFPMVRFDNGMLLALQHEPFELNGSNGSTLERAQVPLKLGWALTIHKAAGLTLSRAELLIDGAFEAGQAYVALSRLTGTEGLWTSGRGIRWANTKAHPDALKFYEEVAVRQKSCSANGKAIAGKKLTKGAVSSSVPADETSSQKVHEPKLAQKKQRKNWRTAAQTL